MRLNLFFDWLKNLMAQSRVWVLMTSFSIWLTYLRGWFLNVGVKYTIYMGVPFQSFSLKVKLYLGLWGRIGHFVGWRRISIKWWLRSVVTSFGWQILALGDTFFLTLVIPLWIEWWCNTVDQQFETFSLWWFVTFESRKKNYKRFSIALVIFGSFYHHVVICWSFNSDLIVSGRQQLLVVLFFSVF